MQFEEMYKNNTLFVKVLKSSDLTNKKGIKIQFEEDDDMQVAIFRIDGNLFCVSNICPHRHAEEIYNGLVKDCTVQCPLHAWTYDLKSGVNTNQKQGIKSLKTFKIIEEDSYIWIEKPSLEIPKWRISECDF